jgi:Spy/CpxP family protein refolding chaperone
MNAKILLGIAAVVLLQSNFVRAQDPQPAPPPDRPERPDTQELRQELRDLPPEERQARMRELREQYGRDGAQPGQRPLARQFREQNPPMGGGAAGGLGRVALVLTPEQRASLRDASEEDRDKVRQLNEQLREARKAVAEASFAKEFKEDELRAKLEAAAKIDTELTIIRARALASIEPPLSDEQIEKAKNPPPRPQLQPDRQPGQPRPRPPGDQPVRRGPDDQGNRPPPGPL